MIASRSCSSNAVAIAWSIRTASSWFIDLRPPSLARDLDPRGSPGRPIQRGREVPGLVEQQPVSQFEQRRGMPGRAVRVGGGAVGPPEVATADDSHEGEARRQHPAILRADDTDIEGCREATGPALH